MPLMSNVRRHVPSPPIPEADSLAHSGKIPAAILLLEGWLDVEPWREDVRTRIAELVSELSADERRQREWLRGSQAEAQLRRSMPRKAVLLGAGLALLFWLAALLLRDKAAGDALRSLSALCFGMLGMPLLLWMWWKRLPFAVQGGLDPSRPFFYHLGQR
jgi:hypothetical protein